MSVRLVFLDSVELTRKVSGGRSATCLVDLACPCDLACPRCERRGRPVGPSFDPARRRLLATAGSRGLMSLRAVFYGGEVAAYPAEIGRLAERARGVCDDRGVAFEGFLISPGTSWTAEGSRRLRAAGVLHAQVTLDGPRAIHDQRHPLKGGEGSFDRILRSIELCREGLDVAVRINAEAGDPAVELLVEQLAAEGLFAEPNPIRVLVGRRAPYRQQIRQLLAALDATAPGDQLAAP